MPVQHIFISYAHEDGDQYRAELINKLKAAGFKDDDYWYDKRDIELGEEWRTDIDRALNTSFIMIIILTPCAVESHFVTYEWTRAIADNLKVIPIVFEKLQSDLKHPLMERKQWITWEDKAVSDQVIETIKQYENLPPDASFLHKIIMNEVILFRALARVTLWLYPYSQLGIVDTNYQHQLIDKLMDLARDLFSQKLPELMVTKSHAFSSKQSRACRQLIQALISFWEIFYTRNSINSAYFSPLPITNAIIEKAESNRLQTIESIIEFFETGTHFEEAFKRLDYFLGVIPRPNTEVFYPPTDELLLSIQYDFLSWIHDNSEDAETLINAIQAVKNYGAET